MTNNQVLTSHVKKSYNQNPDVGFTFHASEQMTERDVSIPDVKSVLTKGQVVGTDVHPKTGNVLWLMEGKDDNGRRIRLVIDSSKQPRIKIITVINKDR